MRVINMKHTGILILLLSLVSCGKTTRMHQKAYDFSEAGRYPRALELYQEMMEKKSEDALYLNDYGWTLFMADSLEAALQKLEKAEKVCSENQSILKRNIDKNLKITNSYIQAKKSLRQGNPDKAKELLDEIDKSWKPREMKLKYYAMVHEKMGNKEIANEYWRRILNFYAEEQQINHFQKLAGSKLDERETENQINE